MNVSLTARFRQGLGGIVLAFTLDPRRRAAQQPRLPAACGNRMLDAWIRINADGTVTVFTGKVELGQGIVTALAQIAAEELDLPLARVSMISGDTGRTPNEGMTAGSAVGREYRHGAAAGGRGSARASCRACVGAARDERGFAQRRGRRHQRGERPEDQLWELAAALASSARRPRR